MGHAARPAVEFRYTVGLPGSGKTSYAQNWVNHSPFTRARVNRDDLRAMIHPGLTPDLIAEAMVTKIQYGAIVALLKEGVSVISDDTNLHPDYLEDLLATVRLADDNVLIRKINFTNVTVGQCILNVKKRVATGGRDVPERVIRRYHDMYLADTQKEV